MAVAGTSNYTVPTISKEFGYVPFTNQDVFAINAIKYSDGSSKIKLLPDVDYVQVLKVSRGDEYLAALHQKGIRIWKLK